MGWLFALALGLQQRSERAIWVSLIPIALGHAASLALVALAVGLLGPVVPLRALTLGAGVALVALGLYKLRNWYRHPRWVGMRVSLADLFGWSFLMASAHGAGLMVAPPLIVVGAGARPAPALALGVALHTAAMLAVMAAVAWIVYRRLGLEVLRRAWINFDLIWAAALLVVGLVAVAGAGLRGRGPGRMFHPTTADQELRHRADTGRPDRAPGLGGWGRLSPG